MRMMVVAVSLVGMAACTVDGGRDGDDPGFGFSAGDSATGDAGDSTGADESGDDESGTASGSPTSGGSDTDPTGGTDTDDTGQTGGALDCPVPSEWSISTPFADGDDHSHPLPSFAVGDWYYVHTITGGDRVLWSARAHADGSLGPWQVASNDHGGGPHGFTALAIDQVAYHFRNGHIAEYPLDARGMMNGDVVLLEDDPNDAFGGEKFVWDSAVEVSFPDGPRWAFHLGGFSFGPYDYRRAVRRNSLPMGARFEDVGIDHPADRPGKAAAHVPPGSGTGWVFSGEAGGRGLWRATVESDGTMTGWDALDDLPEGTGNERGDLLMAGRALLVVRGSAVFRALVDDDTGALGPWAPMPSLPEDQIDVHWGDGHGEGAAWGRIGDTLYLTGPRAVFHATLEPGDCG